MSLTSDTYFQPVQIAKCNFTPITSAPQCMAHSHHMTVKSSQSNLWELLEALAIMGILGRARKDYSSSVQITDKWSIRLLEYD